MTPAPSPTTPAALLVKQVPTGTVASYAAVTAILVVLAAVGGGTDQLLPCRFAEFAGRVLGSLALAYVSYIGRQAGPRVPPPAGG